MRDSQPFISGAVQIHSEAIIAADVVLQAEEDGAIAIESGVCIGSGSVIHASGGSITIAQGAILGSGVLLVGTVTVGNQACIGSASTIMDAAIEPGMMLPSGSLVLCDLTTSPTLHVSSVSFEAEIKSFTAPATPPPQAVSDPWGDEVDQGADYVRDHNGNATSVTPTPAPTPASPIPTTPIPTTPISTTPISTTPIEDSSPVPNPQLGATAIYGKVRLNKLLMTLLPHRQADMISPPPFEDD